MTCDVDPDELSAGQSHDDECIEQVEAKGWATNRSMAAMSGEWLRRNVRHAWGDDGSDRLTMYFATVD